MSTIEEVGGRSEYVGEEGQSQKQIKSDAQEETCKEHKWVMSHMADRLMEMSWVKMKEQASNVPEP